MQKSYKIFLLIFFVCFLTCCKGKKEIKTEIKEAEETVKTTVTIVEPELQILNDHIELNGSTIFQKKLVVRANITGFINYMPWKTGDIVRSGSLFCNIKTKEQVALKDIDMREPSLRQFQQPISIRTNASGYLTSVNYIKGDFVNEGDVLATITDPSSLVLLVNVPYEYHKYVYSGRSVEVLLPDGEKIFSSISKGIPIMDTATQTEQFYIKLSVKQQLPENMNMVVRIPINEGPRALSLPPDAVQTNETQDEFWVMKLVNDSMAVRIPVTIGAQNASFIEIKSGIDLRDKIIWKGAYGLADSATVKVEEKEK